MPNIIINIMPNLNQSGLRPTKIPGKKMFHSGIRTAMMQLKTIKRDSTDIKKPKLLKTTYS